MTVPTPRRPASRHRGLAFAATAALVAGPLLAGVVPGAAGATPPAASETVTFSGGCGVLGVGASSEPDVDALEVPAGAKLTFVNDLGQRATLLLDGERAAQVDRGDAVPVTFHSGRVEVSMRLQCLLQRQAGTVAVDVVPAASAPPPTAAADAADAGNQGSGDPTAGDEATGSGGSEGPAGAGEGPGSAGAEQSPPAGGAPGDEAPGSGLPGGTEGAGEAPGGSGDRETRHPYGVGGPDGVPADGPMSGLTGPGDGGFPGGGAGPEADVAGGAGAPATVDRPGSSDLRPAAQARDDARVGVLALVATVFLVGVSAGAARVLISQRSHRAKWA